MSITIYKQIADIALNAKGPIKITELAVLLNIPKNGRNIHNYIRGAYNHYEKNDKIIAGKISGVYTDDNGNYVYQK